MDWFMILMTMLAAAAMGMEFRSETVSKEKEKEVSQKKSYEWSWKDWLGLSVICLVIWGILAGVNPLEMLKVIKELPAG